MGAVKCSAALMVWGLIFIACISMVHCIVSPEQLTVTTVGDNRPLNPGRITVGSASDLALEVRCSSDIASWFHGNGTAINEGLSPFGVSQEDGVLRVYPVTLLNLGPNDFVCSDGNNMLAVQFDRVPHLFFTSPVPRQAPPGSDITSLCPVSDIPTADVTVVNGTGFSYCLVTTERGLFRSQSIVEEEAAIRVIITPPVNNTVLAPELAVFTCTVEGFPLPTISWVTIPNDSDIEITLTSGNNIDITESISNSFTVTSNLTIMMTVFTLAGMYVCVASNSEGMVNESAILTVNVLPRFLVNPMSDVLAVTGDDITLNCTAEGNPLPIVTWAVNTTDKTLSNPDENFDITLSNDTSTITVTSVLRFTADVMDPLRGNGTQYFCRASNGLEPEIESNSTLLTFATSSPPTGLMAVSTQTTISLSWGAPSSPNGVITHYDVSFVGTRDYDASFSDHTNSVRLAREDISTDGGFEHSLEDLFPNTQYTVTVVPVNGAGREMASSVTVNTLHEPVLTQLRLIGVDRCQQWVSEQKLNTLSEALSVNVEERCQCGFSVSNVLNPTFRCFPESENAVTYRAEVSGAVSTSSSQIVNHIEDWLTDGALVMFDFITIPIDSSCRVGLFSNTDPECNGPTTAVVTLTPTSPEISSEFPVAAVGGAVGGVIVLIIAIVVLILSVYIWLLIKRSRSFQLAKNMPSGAEMNVVVASSEANEGEYETIDNFQDTILKPQEYEDVQFPPTTSPNPPPTVPEYEYVTTGTVVSDTSKKDFDFTDCAAYGVTRTH